MHIGKDPQEMPHWPMMLCRLGSMCVSETEAYCVSERCTCVQEILCSLGRKHKWYHAIEQGCKEDVCERHCELRRYAEVCERQVWIRQNVQGYREVAAKNMEGLGGPGVIGKEISLKQCPSGSWLFSLH